MFTLFVYLSPFIAVVLAFVLNEAATRRHAEKKHQELKRNVQTLIYLEVEHNLDILREFWASVDSIHGPTPRETDFLQIATFANATFPKWAKLMWESLAPSLPSALTEATIQQLYFLYDQLDVITTLSGQVRKLLPDHIMDDYVAFQHERIERAGPIESQTGAVDFGEWDGFKASAFQIPDVWQRARILIIKIINANNPVDRSPQLSTSPLSTTGQRVDSVVKRMFRRSAATMTTPRK